MTNELAFNLQQIIVKPGLIEFNEFDRLKSQALQLAENIGQVEVNEETIQFSKKMLTAVNAKIKELESKRISIKKEMLEPYDTFEKQVKEIVTIVKDADNLVRDQVRTLEERERDAKREQVAEIFGKRIGHYIFGEVFTFEKFIKPSHLNKSTSIKSVEKEMVDWLEKIDNDLKVIGTLVNSDSVLAEYYDTKDLTTAINIVNDREAIKNSIVAQKVIKNTVRNAYTITIDDEKDFKLVEMFMQNNNIKYNSKRVGN
jgi:hypothetical protein